MTKRKWIILITVTVLISILNFQIEKSENNITNTYWYDNIPIKEDHSIGTITIDKIKILEKLYDPKSKENNIEKHIAFALDFKSPKTDSIILMAHSGTGKIAYFRDLDKLHNNDSIKLEYQGEDYIYTVTNVSIVEKNGTLNITKDLSTNALILTTCMPNQKNKQLVIVAKKKDINPS